MTREEWSRGVPVGWNGPGFVYKGLLNKELISSADPL